MWSRRQAGVRWSCFSGGEVTPSIVEPSARRLGGRGATDAAGLSPGRPWLSRHLANGHCRPDGDGFDPSRRLESYAGHSRPASLTWGNWVGHMLLVATLAKTSGSDQPEICIKNRYRSRWSSLRVCIAASRRDLVLRVQIWSNLDWTDIVLVERSSVLTGCLTAVGGCGRRPTFRHSQRCFRRRRRTPPIAARTIRAATRRETALAFDGAGAPTREPRHRRPTMHRLPRAERAALLPPRRRAGRCNDPQGYLPLTIPRQQPRHPHDLGRDPRELRTRPSASTARRPLATSRWRCHGSQDDQSRVGRYEPTGRRVKTVKTPIDGRFPPDLRARLLSPICWWSC